MAHESFEDSDTATFMNQRFINIKVDREERPDLDSIYMDAVVSMTGRGGWPLSVFLTPGGEPFFGGTYFPPTARQGLPSFMQVLAGVDHAWIADREGVVASASNFTGQIGRDVLRSEPGTSLEPAVLSQAADGLFRGYDWTHGGWSGAPKFPQPLAIEFLLQRAAVHGDMLARDMAVHALRRMADGGIYDHLGGGFARYAVDGQWTIPHFEKMLYDNAQLIRVYLHAWQLTGDTRLLSVASETVAFCMRELKLPEGGFAASLDADSEDEEGKFYVWDREGLEQAIADPAARQAFAQTFGLTGPPNFEGRYVLRRRPADENSTGSALGEPDALEALLEVARRQALVARERRVRPALDDKVLACWNGLMLSALSEFARATDGAEAAKASRELSVFLRDQVLEAGRPRRAWRAGRTSQTGFLEDCAALGLGWLSHYELTFEPEWYQQAKSQAEVILEYFTDSEGGFFDTPSDQSEKLLVRPKTLQDSPTPSGNAMATSLMLRMAALTGEVERYGGPAHRSLEGMQANARTYPTAFAGWLGALEFALGPQLQLGLVGFEPMQSHQRLRAVADHQYLPELVMAGRADGDAMGPALLQDRQTSQGHPTAFLCQGFTCRLPTTDPEELRRQLAEARRS
jgi:uncharacterized protein YyaL (SSP411 family)